MQRYACLAWVTVRTTQITVVLMAAVGAYRLYKNRSLIDWRLEVQIAFVILLKVLRSGPMSVSILRRHCE
jgi:hypothetical protein